MIRRDATFDDGSPAWILITQIQHARVAGALAESWGLAPFSPVHPRDVVLPTIYGHDDGWLLWEQQPTIDPDTGRPRSFTEMPDDVAHEIWRRSIASVAGLGPLAQYMVAQHFMRLRRGGHEMHEPAVIAFLEEFDDRCRDWLAAWQVEDSDHNTPAAAENAVDQLQTFDALSLALCCAGCVGLKELPTPLGLSLSLEMGGRGACRADEGQRGVAPQERRPPKRQSRSGLEIETHVRPWAWTEREVSISARGCVIAAEPLTSDEELRERMAGAAIVDLHWRLTP